ncbi:MAG: DNA alkylation repair protein [bacterium]
MKTELNIDDNISFENLIEELKIKSSSKNTEGMSRFGINVKKAFGVTVKDIKIIAKPVKNNHDLAVKLWKTGIHEAQLMSSLLDEYVKVTEEQMELQVLDFDSWDVCDLTCNNLYVYTQYCEKKIFEWTGREEEFVKRAGYVLIACSAVHHKEWSNEKFISFLPLIEEGLNDERNFVKKAVNWALRGIGKKNKVLNAEAVKFAERFVSSKSKTARWIVNDAIRELKDEKTLKRVK